MLPKPIRVRLVPGLSHLMTPVHLQPPVLHCIAGLAGTYKYQPVSQKKTLCVCVCESSSSSSGNVQRPSSVIIDMYWGVKLAQRKKQKKKKKEREG
jgi:hypothetical protein